MTELLFSLLCYLSTSIGLDDDWIATTLDVDSVATSRRLLLDKGISLACLDTKEFVTSFTPTIHTSHHSYSLIKLSYISNIYKTKSTLSPLGFIHYLIHIKFLTIFSNVGPLNAFVRQSAIILSFATCITFIE